MTWPLRATVFAIAITGAVDPSFTWRHREKPVVSLVAADERDAPLRDRAAAVVSRDFTVVTRPDAGASAVVAVGHRPPADLRPGRIRAFALRRDEPVSIAEIDLPERVRAHARVAVRYRAVSRGTAPVEAQLRVNGLTVDRQTITPASSGDVTGTLTFAATGAGIARVQLAVSSGAASASADQAIEVEAARWKIVSFDPRPSWASTFVRRSIEDDPRFLVTAHVETSSRSSVDTGAPPALVNVPGDVDVVLVGAPDAVSAADVDRLEAFARAGGSVCLLLDRAAAGPFDRLTGARGWTSPPPGRRIDVVADDRIGRLFASDFAEPQLDARASVIAAAGHVPAVWRVPIGNGTVIVSGALDAWRYRASAGSGFDAFWRTIVADGAESARRRAAVWLGGRLFTPGERLDVHTSAAGILIIDGPGGRETPVPLRAGAGDFFATPAAPRTAGLYRAAVDASGASAPFLVVAKAERPSEPALLTAWATAHGGTAFDAGDLAGLDSALRGAIEPPVHTSRVFPLRSPWWLPVFALAAGVEWWLRRRRGRS